MGSHLLEEHRQPSPGATPETNFEPGMAERIAACDWSATPLGPRERWPEALKVALQIVLSSRFPMFIWWGPELINIYNDAYAPMLGKKHPASLARPASEVWSEIWDVVGPQADLVIQHRQSTWNEEMLLVMERYGYNEETYFTWSYSPIGDGSGEAAGLFCAVTEDTSKVIGRRRLKTLRELATETADLRTAPEAFAAAEAVIRRNPYDIPFALLYEMDADGTTATLACATGIGEDYNGAPVRVGIDREANPWGVDLNRDEVRVIGGLDRCFSEVPAGPWPQPPGEALLLPFAKRSEHQPSGFMIAGVSRYTCPDEECRGFLSLVARHIAIAVANSRAYEAERKRAEMLMEIDRAKTAFFSNVSHEFRTPLTLMIGPLEDALANAHGVLPMGAARDLNIAHRNAMRLLKLVNTLLDFARIEAGRVQAAYQPTDLSALTQDVASVFQSAMERAGLELVIDTPPLEPVYVDREMWEKIVLNLLSNAFKFTFEGQVRVSLSAADGMVRLVVSDTGTGIPAEELPKLFERFHRTKGARGRSFEGSGIGLALIQELVKLHGGTVTVESELHHGSRFIVSIPMGKAHLPADRIGAAREQVSTAARAEAFVEEALRMLPEDVVQDAAAGRVSSAGDEVEGFLPAGSSTTRPRILVADDNADMRAYARRLLNRDYDVALAADGAAALKAIQANPPDLVLTDIMMPRLDGFGLLRALRADPRTREIPVILLTARAGEEERIGGLETGADEYITKPFSARELLARVEAALKLQRVRGESNRALRESERRLSRLVAGLTRLHDLGRELSATTTEAAGLAVILRGMADLYQTDRGLISVCRPGNTTPTDAVWLGFDANAPALDQDYEALTAAARLAIEQKRVVAVEDVQSDATFAACREPARRLGLRAVYSYPLESRAGDCLAVLSVYFADVQPAEELQSQLAELHRRQAADFIEGVRAAQAQRESEARYRTLFNSMDEGFCTVEVRFDENQQPVDYRFLEVNAAFERQTGIHEAQGRWMREIAPAHENHWFETYGRIARTGQAERFENEAKQLGRWYDVYAFRVDRPELRRVAIVFNDITERRRREEQLRQANRDLEQFAYSASHDLQEPLRVVNIYSQLLEKRARHKLDDAEIEFLYHLRSGATRMEALVRGLLTYTQAVKFDAKPDATNANEALRAALSNLDETIRASGARIDAEPLPSVRAYGVHLQQLFQNLVSNAIKYRSPERMPVVRVAAERHDRWWQFSVADNGIGIESEYLETIFGLFKRLHTGDEYAGAGIGLAICQRIVERYGGRIWVESEAGQGSTFRFTLPE